MKEGRLSLRGPLTLFKEMKAYARRRETTVTAIVLAHFKELIEADRKMRAITQTVDSEQV